jgi:hypothetical protein
MHQKIDVDIPSIVSILSFGLCKSEKAAPQFNKGYAVVEIHLAAVRFRHYFD